MRANEGALTQRSLKWGKKKARSNICLSTFPRNFAAVPPGYLLRTVLQSKHHSSQVGGQIRDNALHIIFGTHSAFDETRNMIRIIYNSLVTIGLHTKTTKHIWSRRKQFLLQTWRQFFFNWRKSYHDKVGLQVFLLTFLPTWYWHPGRMFQLHNLLQHYQGVGVSRDLLAQYLSSKAFGHSMSALFV